MKHVLVIIIVFLGLSSSVSASHFRAGEITYVQLSERTFEVTVTTYTLFDVGLPDDVGSNAADNPFVMVTWGDNSPVEDVNRTVLEQVSPTIRRNEYTATHTYPVGAGASYRISIAEANRIDGIVNINEGNSLFQMFYLETVINIQDPVFLGLNSSPILLQPPLDNGFIDARFIHNPNAFDPDGDSLAYELIVPQVDIGQEVERYRSPDLVNPGPNNVVTFDELTGDFIWDTPQQVGIYNIAILVREFRNGALISEIVRDIQFTIENGDINPPTVETINDTCIVAGTLLEFEVFGDDEDAGQRVLLSATGGPLQFSPAEGPATFTAPAVFQDPIVSGNFSWQTECQHIRRNPYQIVFRAVDDFDGEGLATLERLNITVAPPPPVIIDVVPDGLTNVITWESPYPCEDDDSFVGFRVYRRIGPSEIELDTCNPSLPGYELIEQNTTEVLNGDFIFRDENIEPGIIYCYRVVATYAENFFNAIPFESLASEQICIIAEQDIPFVTQVDVAATSTRSWVR